MSKVPVAVFGAGHLGVAHLKKYQMIEEVDLIGFWDIDEVARDTVEQGLGVKPFDPEILLDKAAAINIVTPTTTHADICVEAASRGKHIFVEKPIASTIEDADRMIDACERANVLLQVGHIERFNSAFRNTKKDITTPKFIEAHRLAAFNSRGLDVSVVLDLMIHDIDLILSIIPDDVEQINANGVGVVSDNLDLVNARIHFEGGTVANLTASRISQKAMRKIRIFQKEAYVSLDFGVGESEVFKVVEKHGKFADKAVSPIMQLDHHDIHKTVGYKKIENDGKDSLELEIRSFIDAVQTGREPEISGYDGRDALAIALEILENIGAE